MSRKSREDKSLWKVPAIYALVGNYGPFRTKGHNPIDNVVVLLHNSSSSDNSTNDKDAEVKHHPMYELSGQAQPLLLDGNEPNNSNCPNGILVIDVQNMFEDPAEYDEALTKELEETTDLTKGFGKSLLRLFQRMFLQNITLAATGTLCGILLKLERAIRSMDAQMVSKLVMIHPNLSTKFVNTHLTSTTGGNAAAVNGMKNRTPLDLVMEKPNSARAEMLRYFFPLGNAIVSKADDSKWLLTAFGQVETTTTTTSSECKYDADYCNYLGKSLFVSQITVEMNRHTKQYERSCEDITSKLLEVTHIKPAEETEMNNLNNVDWTTAEKQVGALVLRGNRCVLVRSLKKEWAGMRIPSVVPKEDETQKDAAIRAVVEYTGVDATEVKPLADVVLPVSIYGPNNRPIVVTLYPLYATEPPPDGPLEDADLEDDETSYDWYLYANAVNRLDVASAAALQTMALVLMQAANVGLVPAKWGGVFGQELQLSFHGASSSSSLQQLSNGIAPMGNSTAAEVSTTAPSSALLTAQVEEWKPSRQGDILQDVRKANQMVTQRLADRKQQQAQKKLPVTLLSGFLGSGKTTLLSHILSNYDGLRVAILVNDMGEVNIDAALVKSTVSIRQREEHMVELSNGCICCTLREDLLVEVANIAAAEEGYDYLIIESTGVSEPMPVAETFTFEDSTGLRLGDVAEIDTLVTVVDGSRFLAELDSLESLRARDWHADPEDQRTISHLLCDQVEFANVIVLNKCDLIGREERDKVKLLIQNMNPTAKVVESTHSAVPLDSVLGTGLFSMSEAEKHTGWLQEARIGEHTPETEEYGIGSFTFRATKPFNPNKLHGVLEAMLESSAPPFDSSVILRSKGFVWLASCNQLQGDFSLAGNHYSLLPGNPWWAEIDKSHWPENLERDIAPLWHEPYGDRQQEIVIIGQSLERGAITKALNDCLVSDEDFAQGPKLWESICEEEGDPFQEEWQMAIDMAMQANNEHDHSHDYDNAQVQQ